MPHRVTQPTKEEVRAYMAKRERARRPPPAPEDIRRQLGWYMMPNEPTDAIFGLLMLPATLGECTAKLALNWCLTPFRAVAGRAITS